MGWDGVAGEPVDRAQLRTALLRFLADMGDPAVVAEARARFARYLADPKSLEPALLDVVTRTVGGHADQPTYDTLLELARKAEGTEEKNRFYAAALSVRDPALAAQALPLALSKELPPLIASRVLVQLSAEHTNLVWAYAQQHADALLKMQPDYERSEFFPSLLRRSTDAAHADALLAFVKAHHPPEALVLAERSAEGIRLRAQRKAACYRNWRSGCGYEHALADGVWFAWRYVFCSDMHIFHGARGRFRKMRVFLETSKPHLEARWPAGRSEALPPDRPAVPREHEVLGPTASVQLGLRAAHNREYEVCLGLCIRLQVGAVLRDQIALQPSVAFRKAGVGPHRIAKAQPPLPRSAAQHYQVQVVCAPPVGPPHQPAAIGQRGVEFRRRGVVRLEQRRHHGIRHPHGCHAPQ